MLKGICVAICTTFDKKTQAFDERAYLKHLDRMLEAGVQLVAVCGGTGEFAYLETEERRRIAEVTAKHVEGKASLIVHASAARTGNAVETAKHAEGVGAAAVLVLPAIFEGAAADGVFKHYETIGKAVKIPIMVYNIPQNSGFAITPEYYGAPSRHSVRAIHQRQHRRSHAHRAAHSLGAPRCSTAATISSCMTLWPGPRRLFLGRRQRRARRGGEALYPGHSGQVGGSRRVLEENESRQHVLLE